MSQFSSKICRSYAGIYFLPYIMPIDLVVITLIWKWHLSRTKKNGTKKITCNSDVIS